MHTKSLELEHTTHHEAILIVLITELVQNAVSVSQAIATPASDSSKKFKRELPICINMKICFDAYSME